MRIQVDRYTGERFSAFKKSLSRRLNGAYIDDAAAIGRLLSDSSLKDELLYGCSGEELEARFDEDRKENCDEMPQDEWEAVTQ
jgi:hypothetical protein